MTGKANVMVGSVPTTTRPLQPRILARLAASAPASSSNAGHRPPPRANAVLDPPGGRDHATGPPDEGTVVEAGGPTSASSRGAGRGDRHGPLRVLPLVVAVLVLVAGIVVLLGRGGAAGPGPGEAVVDIDGRATVTRATGGTEEVVGRTRLGPGDQMAMQRGAADLQLSGGVSYEARGPTRGEEGSELVMGRVPRLVAGSILVTSPAASSVTAGEAMATVEASSTVRVSRTIAIRVDVYRGRARLASSGAERVVSGLRAAEVVADGDIGETRPISYDNRDGWDRRYLGPALALDGQLGPLEAGLAASDSDVMELAQRLRSRLDQDVTGATLQSVVEARDGRLDAVIGLAVLASSDRGSFTDRWERAFTFHDAGAPWGLVAMDLDASPDAIVDALAGAIDAAPLGRAAAPEASADGASSTGGPTASVGPPDTPTATPAPGETPTATPRDTPTATPAPRETPTGIPVPAPAGQVTVPAGPDTGAGDPGTGTPGAAPSPPPVTVSGRASDAGRSGTGSGSGAGANGGGSASPAAPGAGGSPGGTNGSGGAVSPGSGTVAPDAPTGGAPTVPPQVPVVGGSTIPVVGPVVESAGSAAGQVTGPIVGPVVGPGGPLGPVTEPVLGTGGNGGLLGPPGPLGPLTGPGGPTTPVTGPLTGPGGLLNGSNGVLPHGR